MSKASIEQIVELVSFHLSFISNLTTSLAQTEEATCCSVVVFACIENTPVPKDNEDGEDSADGTADLLWHTSYKVDKLFFFFWNPLECALGCMTLCGTYTRWVYPSSLPTHTELLLTFDTSPCLSAASRLYRCQG